jgi:hypothetical protein
LCAAGITVLVFRNRGLRKRYGDIPVRVKRSGKTRWTGGHAVWVSDVFAWRGSPAAWSEDVVQVTGVRLRSPDEKERHKLRRLGDGVQIATLSSPDGEPLDVATWSQDRTALLGPFLAPNLKQSPKASITDRAEPTAA